MEPLLLYGKYENIIDIERIMHIKMRVVNLWNRLVSNGHKLTSNAYRLMLSLHNSGILIRIIYLIAKWYPIYMV